ncbi:MAG: NDP-sugar synthase [Elusimicrobia bacterium]|nr:NDP-sugar synthase [Elusimicrobiota bacterium]
MKAMILAAGAGTRLRPITYELPKPLVPVVNRPVLHHVLDTVRQHGIKEVVINLHAHADRVRHSVGNGSAWGLKIHFSYEKNLLGTAGAVKKAARIFKDGPFFVLSGDGLSDIDLTDLMAFHQSRRSLATMAIKAVDHRFEYGVTLTNSQQKIKGFLEKPSWADVFSNTVNTGIYVFDPKILALIPEGKPYDFGHELWPLLLKKGAPIYGYLHKKYWCDVGNLGEYRKSQKDALDGTIKLNFPGVQVRSRIWVDKGCRIHPKAKLIPPVTIGRNCRIDSQAEIGPYTVVGDSSKISSRAILKNCILFKRVQVGRNVHLSNCIIGEEGQVTESVAVYEAAVLNIRQ